MVLSLRPKAVIYVRWKIFLVFHRPYTKVTLRLMYLQQ
jgi:hypothetical protein